MATTRLMTAEDLFEIDDDKSQRELIRGELVTMSPASIDHSVLAGWIHTLLNIHVVSRELGFVSTTDGGYTLHRDPDTVLAPDVAFVRAGRLPEVEGNPPFPEVAPDLVVEVISPSDRSTYVNDKVALYLGAGVQLVWVVDPRRKTVAVYSRNRPFIVLSTDDTLGGDDVLPEFSISVDNLFTRKLPSNL